MASSPPVAPVPSALDPSSGIITANSIASSLGISTSAAESFVDQEEINQHDLCPVCHLLLYRPVTTTCTHSLCEACMKHWAAVSSSNAQARMETFDFEDHPDVETTILGPSMYTWRALLRHDLINGRSMDDPMEATCPMCRTRTTAVFNAGFAANIRARYPVTYAAREREELESQTMTTDEDGQIISIELLIGNKHKLVPAREDSGNRHDWTFFIKPNRCDFIDEVEIHLHPTFRPPRLSLSQEPFQVRRLGWGYFTIVTHIILKHGYTWLSGDAERGPDGRDKGMLHLDWTLDFHGKGSFGRIKARVKRDADWVGDDETEEDDDDDDDDDEMYDTIE